VAGHHEIREPGGSASSSFLDRGYGITVTSFVKAAHPDARAAAVRLLSEFVEAWPDLGPFDPGLATVPVAYKHGGEVTITATHFVSADGLAKWDAAQAAKSRNRKKTQYASYSLAVINN
jgi:hypothetical protein